MNTLKNKCPVIEKYSEEKNVTIKKCDFKKCSNHNYLQKNNCNLYECISNCGYEKQFFKTKTIKRMEDYEAFNIMHDRDGSNTSMRFSKL